MTTNFHTPIVTGAAANASIVNSPLAELDAAVTAIDFTYSAVSTEFLNGDGNFAVPAGTGASVDGHAITDEGGADLTQRAKLDFIGAGVVAANGVSATEVTISGDIINDTTPQLGGDLDLNGKNLDFPTTANISDCLDENNMVSDSATMLATQQSIKAYGDSATQSMSNKTLTSPVLNGTLSGTAFLDENNMVSDSAIAAASQQSIKAYVDNNASGLDYSLQGRLTLETGVPISTSDQVDKTTVYFTPFMGNQIALYDGTSAWATWEFAEKSFAVAGVTLPTEAFTNDPAAGTDISLSVASTTGFTVGQPITVTSDAGSDTTSISALTTDTSITAHTLAVDHTQTDPLITGGIPVDIFIYDNSGTLTLSGEVWTNATTRATALTLQDGVLVKTGATDYRYLGTIYIDAGQKCQYVLSSPSNIGVWNYYNRREIPLNVVETTNQWNYTTATWREANGSTANRIQAIIGVAEDTISVRVLGLASNSSAIEIYVGIGVDVTNANNATVKGRAPGGASVIYELNSMYKSIPAAGYHFYQWTEYSGAAGTTTYYGDAGVSDRIQSGMIGEVMG